MQCFQGKSVYKGIAMGPIVVLKKDDYQVKRTRIEDPEAEVKRVDAALEKSKEQLQKLYDKAVKEVGEASAAIFEVHQMMLEDDDYLEAIQNTICTEQVNAEYAVATTGDNFAEMFASMDDDYMKARSADIKDISERLVRNLSGQEDTDLSSIDPSVIVADDLSPSETVQMDKDKILAFVTVHGSTNSHTAILARMMNIPALIGVPMDLDELKTGMTAVVDGFEGTVTFDPDEEIKAQTEKRMEEEAEKLKLLQELKGKENVTLDGHKINCIWCTENTSSCRCISKFNMVHGISPLMCFCVSLSVNIIINCSYYFSIKYYIFLLKTGSYTIFISCFWMFFTVILLFSVFYP